MQFCCFLVSYFFRFTVFVIFFRNLRLNDFFWKKNYFTKTFFFQKCRFLHKVFNKKFNIFNFIFFSFFRFSVFEIFLYNFNLFNFFDKNNWLKYFLFQKCRSYIFFSKKCKFCWFLIFLFFDFSVCYTRAGEAKVIKRTRKR